ADDRADHGDLQPARRPALRPDRPAHAQSAPYRTVRSCAMTELAHAAPITRSQPRSGAIRQFFIDCPPSVVLALGWMAIMLLIALFVDHRAPFDFKAINVKARLLPPGLFGGDWTHPMG